MRRYPVYKVFCPEFFQFPGTGQNQKTALNVSIIYDEEGERLLFKSTVALEDGPTSLNCQARCIEIYTAMAAVARKLKWIKRPVTSDVSKVERYGVIDGKNVAHIVNYEIGLADRATLTREQVITVCNRFLNPEENTYWVRLQNAEVNRVEDYVEFSIEERDELLQKAREFVENYPTFTETENGAVRSYSFNLDEIEFAPNNVWAVWAIQNAYRGNSKIIRVGFEANYPGSFMKISWKDRDKEKPQPPRLRSNYFANVRVGKRRSDG